MVADVLYQDVSSQEHTTVSVRPDVRDALRERKRGQESYSDLLVRLMEEDEESTGGRV